MRKSVDVPVVHFKNPRTKKTMCGHDYTIPGRTYSNITSSLGDVTCNGCKTAINNSKWIKEMIRKRNNALKNPQKVVGAIIEEMMRSS